MAQPDPAADLIPLSESPATEYVVVVSKDDGTTWERIGDVTTDRADAQAYLERQEDWRDGMIAMLTRSNAVPAATAVPALAGHDEVSAGLQKMQALRYAIHSRPALPFTPEQA